MSSGKTIKDTFAYASLANLVEPVEESSDTYTAHDEALSEERHSMVQAARCVNRLTAQEEHLLAAVDNRNEDKVMGGRLQVYPSKPTVRPSSASGGVSGASTQRGGGGMTSRPSSAKGPIPPAVSLHIPKALQGVIGELSRTHADATATNKSLSRPSTASNAKHPTPPPQPQTPTLTTATTSVTPRPPTASRPATGKSTVPSEKQNAVGAAAASHTNMTSASSLVKVEQHLPTPSERIAHHELGAILRTRYQQHQAEPHVVCHTFRTGPLPISPVPPVIHNEQKGVDPQLSHFLDANAYCTVPDSYYAAIGAQTHARYVVLKKDGEARDVMRACRIIAYHPEHNSFTIQWLHNNVHKVVKPLALMLPNETPKDYLMRVEQSESRRDEEEAHIRFETYAKKRYSGDVAPFPQSQLARITALVAHRFDEKFLTLINECIDDVEDLWAVSIRESIARYHLQSRVERNRVKELRLPTWRRPAPHEVLETPACVDVHDPGYTGPRYTRENYLSARETLRTELFLAHEPLYRTTSFAVQRWKAFEHILLVDTDVHLLNPPMEVSEFKKHQSTHNTMVVKALEKEWIHSIVQAVQAELDGTFDFFLSNVAAYNTSRMARYLRGMNLLLASQLQGLIYQSLEAAKVFFSSLRVDAATLKAVRDEGAGGKSRKSSAFLQHVGCFGTKTVVEPPFIKPVGKMQDVPDEPFGVPIGTASVAKVVMGIIPVLTCRFTVEPRFKKIICTPSLEETEDALREMFSVMLENTDALTGIGPQLFPMLNLRPSNLTEHARSMRRSDERVRSCERELMDMLDENLGGPKALLNLYQPFSYLLQQPTDGFVMAFKKSGPRSADDFNAVCDRLQQHIDMLEHRSLNEVVFPLIKIDCHGIKSALISKAKDIQSAFLRELVNTTNNHIDDIDAKYAHIFHRIQQEPETPEELQELRLFIDQVPAKMQDLQSAFDVITQEVQLLGEYGYMPEQQAFEKYWASYSWPRRISVVMDDVPFHLQMFRAQFLALTHETTNKLQEAIQDCARAVGVLSYEENEAMVDDVVRRVATIDESMQQLKVDTALANQHELIFQQPITKWPLLKDIEKQFLPLAALWRVTAESREVEKWADLNMERLDPQEISSLHASWTKEVNRLGKVLLHEIPYTVVKYVKEKLETFKALLPVINALAKPSLLNRRRHVGRIAEMIGQNGKSFDLREKSPNELMRLGILPHMAAILEISENADHEFKLENQLAAMREEWQKVNFTLQPYMDTYLLKDTDDIRNLADEHVIKTNTMLASPYASAIHQELRPWEEKVSLISRTLDAWLQCQFGFKYLSPMFTQSDDIAAALPEEARSFETVYILWKSVMDSVSKVPSVVIRCGEVKLLDQFTDANVRLDKIMKEICRYLDQKREAFPRFYFLSNEDLIEVLSRSREPKRIQPFIQKCFEGIHHLTIEDGEDNEIIEMVSSERETVGLFEPVFPQQFDNVVDRWLVKLEQTMQKTMNSIIEKGLQSSRTMSREEWVRVWPGQVCIAASQILWTVDAEDSIMKNSLPTFVRRVHQQVRELALHVRQRVSAVEMCTLQALIVIMVHGRDVAESLLSNNVASLDDFLWMAQLRYYWENKKTFVRQTIATLPYGNEYLGNSSRLVITPLTDRCYRTLTSAYHLNFGGAPEGPAGTGKTETTKDLAKAIAKMCVVFNCSDQIKAFEMEKLLRGLAATGSWGCFDEFNRIEVQVLSVIAQQVLTIQLAVAQKRPQFLFEDRLCALREGCSVFITMNPGYAGRTELPDNLKALFRPVAMMVPDYVFIAENSLFSCGFLEATVLAKKIVACYKLSSEQLSSQSHYDFGMRAVKSVLSAAQNLLQSNPNDAESNLVMRAILDVNKPKFLTNDGVLFEGIVSDLFGKPQLTATNYKALDEGIRFSAAQDNLQVPPFFYTKIRQLYELIKVRHGVMIVGHSISGKTAALHTLASGLTWAYQEQRCNEPCTVHTLNPKAVSLAQLYGHNDASGTEWMDGILSHVFRQCSSSTDAVMRHWITLDGPVDSIWIENMNTVLDDNKKLCLTNGDMIRMSNTMTMVFVVQDLFAASPATVSRCGMVYFEPQELGWAPLYESWKNTLSEELENCPIFLRTTDTMIHALLPQAVQFVCSNASLSTPHTQQMIFSQFIRFYRQCIQEFFHDGERIAAAAEADMQMYTEGVFLMSLVWSVGGLLNASDRIKFDGWLKLHIDMDGRKADAYRAMFPLPEHNSVFQYKLDLPKDFAGRPTWVDWLSTVHEMSIDRLIEEPIQEITVPTSDTASLSFITRMLMQQHEPVLFVGPTATGKTMMVKSVLKLQNPNDVCYAHLQFSAQTSAKDLQLQLERRLERRGQRRYGPPLGKSMIVFVDDLGMPEADAYGTQPPIELLRQILMQGGLYSTSRNEFGFRQLLQVYFVGATQPAGTGRSMVSNRLLRHFLTFYIPASTPDNMRRIFSRLYEWIMLQPNVNPVLRTLRDALVNLTVDTFTSITELLLPSPLKSHYLFNLRDLTRVWLGVSSLHPSSTREEGQLVQLVVHECLRVFGDRLVSLTDLHVFEKILDEKLQLHVKRTLAGVTHNNTGLPLLYTNFIVPPHPQAHHAAHAAHPTAAVDVHGVASTAMPAHDTTIDSSERHYTRVPDIPGIGEDTLQHYLNEMAATQSRSSVSGEGNLVVFEYLVEHVARIARVIQQPSGSVLVMGLGGTGRRSAAKVAAFICGFSTKTIRVSSKYTRDSWTDDVIDAMRQSGERGISLLFLLSDTDIKEEGFLEDVCSLLNTGDVPGLLSTDIQDAISHSLKNVAKEAGRDFGREGCMELFVQRVRLNLHFALCFSPAGDTMRVRLRRFPSLVNCTTMNWMPSWPTRALAKVAETKLHALNDVLSPEEIVQASHTLLTAYEDAHRLIERGRETKSLNIRMFLTPTTFLDLLETFSQLLRKKMKENGQLVQRYTGGLDVIHSTEKSVAYMQFLLETNRPKLVEKSAQVAALIQEIDAAKLIAKQERDLVAVEEAQANKIAEDAKAVFDDCEANLAVALPAMKAATDAVSQIDKKQLVELRSLANPSDKIKKVIEAVCIVLEVKPKEVKNPKTQKKELDYWTPTKTKVMAEVEVFRDMLTNFDKDNMKPEIFEDKIQPFIKDKTFRPETVKDVSQALVGVTQWVLAMETYYRVRKVVKPKQEKLAAAEGELKACQAVLAEKKRVLQDIDDRLAVMTQQLKESVEEKESLEQEQRDTEVKLERAIRLNSGLADEKVRYGEQVEALRKKQTTIFADCLFAASILGTLGPFPQEIRQSLRTEWLHKMVAVEGISSSVGYGDATFNEMLSTPVEELTWKVHGLPLDSFSVDSAIIAFYSLRYPLLVDPQGQAVTWIRHTLQSRSLIVVKHSSSELHAKVKEAVSKGAAILVEDCPEDIDPFLYPVLDRDTSMYNGTRIITLGDATIPYNDQVRVILATKIAKPHILPSTSARVSVTQFGITPLGLTEQLLQRVIAHEDRDQDEKRNRVIEQQASSQEQLIALEDAVLTMLSSGKDLLADDDMCEQLETSKKTAMTLHARLADAEAFQKSFDKIRQRYIPIAIKASSLFFAVASLPAINNMYSFSLSWFAGLLLKSLERPHEEGESRTERCQKVLDLFYSLMFQQVSKALFAKDKLAFTVMLLIRIISVPDADVNMFVNGPLDLPVSAAKSALKRPAFLSEPNWRMILRVSEQMPPPLSNMAAIVAANDQDHFGRYCTEDLAHKDEEHAPMFDNAFASVLTPMQRLILVRCLAPRFLIDAVSQTIQATLGQEFLQPPSVDMDRLFKEHKDPTVPIVFVLAPGGDPLTAIRRFVDAQSIGSLLDTLSLGSGMDTRAMGLIKKGSQQGRWVVLQNCHLYPDFMPQLDGIVEVISHQRVETNNTFRLILTTVPTETFPQNLLQRAVKVVLEPPRGIQANLSKLLHSSPMVDPLFFESSKNPSVFKRLAFSLCVFHSVVLERRTFGPIGWNIPYEFTDTDLRISLLTLQYFVDKAAEALIKQGVNLAIPTTNAPATAVAANAQPSLLTATTTLSGVPPPPVKSSSVRTISDEELTAGLSFDALQYLIGECSYGGRVTDVHDRRLLLELLSEFVGPKLLDDEEPHLPIPVQGDIATYQKFAVDAQDQISGPELLGLDSNALVSRDEQNSALLLQLVSCTLPSAVAEPSETTTAAPPAATTTAAPKPTTAPSEEEENPEDLEGAGGAVASPSAASSLEILVSSMLKKLPPPFSISAVEEVYPPNDYNNSLNAVLVQELHRYNRLTNRIRSTLRELQRALKGEAVLTAELDHMAQELLVSTTPMMWKAVSYPCLKPVGSYISDLVQRLEFFQKWISFGPHAVCWLGGLFFPQSFITGTLQNYCRRQHVTIDALTWKVRVLSAEDRDPILPPDAGCYLSGLFLEGCRWDSVSGTLANSLPNVLLNDLPIIHMFPVLQSATSADDFDLDDEEEDGGDDDDLLEGDASLSTNPAAASPKSTTNSEDPTYRCPVYRTQDRHGVLMTTGHSTNFLLYFDLPIPAYTKPSTWVKRGVAAFTTSSQ